MLCAISVGQSWQALKRVTIFRKEAANTLRFLDPGARVIVLSTTPVLGRQVGHRVMGGDFSDYAFWLVRCADGDEGYVESGDFVDGGLCLAS